MVGINPSSGLNSEDKGQNQRRGETYSQALMIRLFSGFIKFQKDMFSDNKNSITDFKVH